MKTKQFEAGEARAMLARARTGTLASIDRDGRGAYASLVNVATDIDGSPIILISKLAWHTRNLETDPRGSLLVAELPPEGDVLAGPRITVMGRWSVADEQRLKRRYLERHPEASAYVDFADFGFWRLAPEIVHAVAGFGRIETFDWTEMLAGDRS